MTPALIFLLNVLCWGWKAEPAFVQAVWRMEQGSDTFYCGRIGQSPYWAPGGVKDCYVKQGTPEELIFLSVRGLRHTRTEAQKIRRLQTYNAEWWKNHYLADVLAQYRRNKQQEDFR